MLGLRGSLCRPILSRRPSASVHTPVSSSRFGKSVWSLSAAATRRQVPSKQLHYPNELLRIFADTSRLLWTSTKRRLYALEKDADKAPLDVHKQLALIRELIKENPRRVTARLETRRFAVDEAVLLEYMKALAQTDRLSHHRDMTELRRRITPLDAPLPFSEAPHSAFSPSRPIAPSHPHQESHNSMTDTQFRYPYDIANQRSATGSPYPYYYPVGYTMAPYQHQYQYPYPYPPPQQQQQDSGGSNGSDSSKDGDKSGKGIWATLLAQLIRVAVTVLLWCLVFFFLTKYLSTQLKGGGGVNFQNPFEGGKVKEVMPQSVNTRFSDVKGCDEAKDELKELVQFLRDPSQFNRLGGELARGVLLTGPPGTGKTLLAKAVAGEASVPFLYASGSEFEEVYVGLGAKRVRELFATAKKKAPCVVFIDEIDAVGGTRKLKDQQAMRMTLNQLLVEMDGFASTSGIVVIGATNFHELLDKALVRPGRFDKHVVVPLPDVKGRKEILDLYLKKIKHKGVDTLIIARGTPGSSGADLFNLVNAAAVHASVLGEQAVGMSHMEWAKDKVLMGTERRSAVLTDAVKKLTAYHEGGHAIVALNTANAMPIHKATIMPRGQALGMVHQLPESDMVSMSKSQLLAMMDVCMGGRVAEEIIFGTDQVTTGASSDFNKATHIAREMVMAYGMSDKVGPVTVNDNDIHKLSPKTRKVIDEEVRKIVDASYQRAKKVLSEKQSELHLLAQALLKYETLSSDEIKNVIAGRAVERPVSN